ncbi:MAG: ABC transporter ATP-binding protein [Dehalococcoidia bacterium]
MAVSTAAAQALLLRDVSHWYPHRGVALHALDHVGVTVAEGEFVSLVGPSGCGKSTLLRIAAGLLVPSSGASTVFARPPREASAARELGLVTQDPGLLPWRTVAANVALSLEVAGLEGAGRAAIVDDLLGRVALRDFAGYYPGQLSGGMRQRVALARALAHRPRMLLMDEPFGALDELSREDLRVELLRIHERDRMTVLFVTHSVREAVLLSDRVLVLSPAPGRVLADVGVDLPRPRDASLEARAPFLECVARVRAALDAGRRDR